MSTPQYKKGDFRSYRAVTKVHLGAIEDNLEEGEVVEYDGQTMKRGGDEHQIATLRAAIKVGWLVPEEQEGGEYVPQPADIIIHDAESTGQDRGEGRRMGTAYDEEKDLGNRKDIRAGKTASEGAPTGAKVMTEAEEAQIGATTTAVTEAGQEGEVVGRFKSSAKGGRVEIGKDDRKVVSQLDNKSKLEVEKIVRAKATGDVQETTVGDDLEELLPDAVSSKKPKPGIAGEGEGQETGEQRAARLAAERKAKLAASDAENNVTVTQTSGSIGGQEDGVIIGSIKKASEPEPADDEPAEEVPPEAILQAKIEMIRQFVPGFEWDMSDHWRTRVKNALNYKDSMPVLNAILSIETDAVKKHVLKGLYGE